MKVAIPVVDIQSLELLPAKKFKARPAAAAAEPINVIQLVFVSNKASTAKSLYIPPTCKSLVGLFVHRLHY